MTTIKEKEAFTLNYSKEDYIERLVGRKGGGGNR